MGNAQMQMKILVWKLRNSILLLCFKGILKIRDTYTRGKIVASFFHYAFPEINFVLMRKLY